MLVKDIMTHNVITITGDTYVLDAEKIMDSNKIGRLPIVDNNRLIGIVTKDDVLKASPSSTTSYNQRQLFYLMSKLTVKEIMKTRVITVTPDTTVEKAVTIAQKHRVGSLPVVEGERVVGILTTNDVFYKILNPLLGIGQAGRRLLIYGAGTCDGLHRVLDLVLKAGIEVKTLWIPKEPDKQNLILHLDTEDVSSIIGSIEQAGFRVELREFEA
ncbi:MAG TPA: CBS domain-containing protein [Syntrophorhabdaceae bacterium]|nr:CBS domain-containing protein [Syntrophorhabdaceae bacterium]HOT42243.1 CBS domain-containing protein [Syntrophorhabdaceae bacterium]HPC67120.1 CBS domain-containing protein [Syntrophorhabdaceae bacterium]HQE80480.1 CBS domain-containing protein [Syntrophorhabdaceae bacterium]HQH43597.1 CBS domain-containing protein [Syntrophorhabdaceae bacterium]